MRLFLLTGVLIGIVGALIFSLPERSSQAPASSTKESVDIQKVWVSARENQFVPGEIKVKALRQVQLEILSSDVDYYVEIPGLGVGPTRIPANDSRVISFTGIEIGAYEMRSLGDPGMTATILVQVCPPEANIQNPVPDSSESIQKGEEVYEARCALCHGVNGDGNGPAAVNAASKPIDFTQPYMAKVSDGEMFWIISNGWYGMPAFKGELTEEQRWQAIRYVRTFLKE